MLAILVAIAVGGGIIAFFALRGGSKKAKPTDTTEQQPANADDVGATQPTTGPQPTQTTAAPTVRPETVAGELERALKKQRLWATVTVIGDHVDIRSGSCGDAGMKPAVETAAESFKASGMTRVRCLEQNGSVVFNRDL